MPIKKKRISFESFGGKQVSCNPYYIYRQLHKLYPDFEYIWVYNETPRSDIKCVKHNTWKYIFTLMTSSVHITNACVLYVPFRHKQQLIIDTWHGGGAYKRIGIVNNADTFNKRYYLYNKTISGFISSSRIFTEIMGESMCIEKDKFLPFGQPRNDIFFDEGTIVAANKTVRHYYSINDEFIILYAPTFRSYDKIQALDSEISFKPIIETIWNKYHRKCRIMVRGHHLLATINITDNTDILNVSDYPYMQELLCAADMLISDYSSCIWDYSFLYRPCILFVPDLSEYQNGPDFYTPIESWGFPIAKTTAELINKIETLDMEEFIRNMKKHHEDLESYENGNATHKICKFIMSFLQRLPSIN